MLLLVLSVRVLHNSVCKAMLISGDGKLESEVLPLSETILIMEIMDRVREIGGLRYPEFIEKV